MNIKQYAHSVRVVLFATRIRKQNQQDRNKGKKGMYFRDTTIGDMWPRVYHTRCACTRQARA